MKIVKLVCAKGKTGFFFDDQKAIKSGAKQDGNTYEGEPMTPGFKNVRTAGESISVLLVLEDGQIAHGDCAAVQYSGTGGRDPLFLAEDFIPVIEKEIAPLLVGREITGFRELAGLVDGHKDKNGKLMHTAIRYGVTQALLDAAAKSQKKLMASVIAQEYGTKLMDRMAPIFSQSGDDRYLNADKMILKGSDSLPHALINNVDAKLGKNGELLADYVKWLSERITKLAPHAGYDPIIHIDVYGTMGIAFNNDFNVISDYIGSLEKLAKPYRLRIEGPVDLGAREPQVEALAEICRLLEKKGISVGIVADEWCNTLEDVRIFTDNKAGHIAQIKMPDLGGINNSIEAVIYCNKNGMGSYLGGTCNETDRSAQIATHIAMATNPMLLLAKPGMGVDEGMMIVYNEMQRILALSK